MLKTLALKTLALKTLALKTLALKTLALKTLALYVRRSWGRWENRGSKRSRFSRRRNDLCLGGSADLQGNLPCETRTPKLSVLPTLGQMLPHAVFRLLYLTIGTGRIVDASGITGSTANAVLEGADGADGNAGNQDTDGG